MFILISLRDILRIGPSSFRRATSTEGRLELVSDAITAKYANKVLDKHGLCIAVHGIDSTEEGKFKPGDGAAYIEATFRLIVFRPFVGEIITGKVKTADATGILVSVEFFDYIFIPASCLPVPSIFVPEQKEWKWQFDGNDLFLELDKVVSVQVTALRFNQNNPTKPTPVVRTVADLRPAFQVVATIQEPGLGMVHWWAGEGEEEELMEDNGD